MGAKETEYIAQTGETLRRQEMTLPTFKKAPTDKLPGYFCEGESSQSILS